MTRSYASLREVCRASVTLLFNKWRPVMSLSEEEKEALKADRAESAARLTDYLRALDQPESQIITALRYVAAQVAGNAKPGRGRMPDVEEIAGKVKARLQVEQAQPCEGCKDMGGFYKTGEPGAPFMDPWPVAGGGMHPWGKGTWLCAWHHEVANWFAYREHWRRKGRSWNYPPPQPCIPLEAWRLVRTGRREEVARVFFRYMDGDDQQPMTVWARRFVEQRFNVTIGEPLLEHAAEAVETPAAPDATEGWDSI